MQDLNPPLLHYGTGAQPLRYILGLKKNLNNSELLFGTIEILVFLKTEVCVRYFYALSQV